MKLIPHALKNTHAPICLLTHFFLHQDFPRTGLKKQLGPGSQEEGWPWVTYQLWHQQVLLQVGASCLTIVGSKACEEHKDIWQAPKRKEHFLLDLRCSAIPISPWICFFGGWSIKCKLSDIFPNDDLFKCFLWWKSKRPHLKQISGSMRRWWATCRPNSKSNSYMAHNHQIFWPQNTKQSDWIKQWSRKRGHSR